jgi:hypothetical protein
MGVNFGALERAFGQMESAFEHPGELMREPVTEWVADVEREQFDSEGAAGASGLWQPDKPQTIRLKISEGYSTRTLERTGATRARLTSVDSLRELIEVSGDRITFRLPAPASYHQRGTATIPAREVYSPSEWQKRDLKARVKKAATEEMRRRGLPVKG